MLTLFWVLACTLLASSIAVSVLTIVDVVEAHRHPHREIIAITFVRGHREKERALRSAGLRPEDVSYINAHGTSTPQGDVCETQAIKTVFRDYAQKLAVSSTKGATGHMLGAAGAVEMAVCAKVIQTNLIPPTINYEQPDPDCDLDYVPNKAREMTVTVALNNSFGFGGHNATMVAKKFVG